MPRPKLDECGLGIVASTGLGSTHDGLNGFVTQPTLPPVSSPKTGQMSTLHYEIGSPPPWGPTKRGVNFAPPSVKPWVWLCENQIRD